VIHAHHDEFFHLIGNVKKIHPKTMIPTELPPGEFFMLHRIQNSIDHSAPDSPCGESVHVSGLNGREDLSMPAVSQLLGNLERKGYVKRQPDENDRRKVTVLLTDSGQTLLKDAHEKIERYIDVLVSRYGEKEFQELCRLASRLADTVAGLKEENLW